VPVRLPDLAASAASRGVIQASIGRVSVRQVAMVCPPPGASRKLTSSPGWRIRASCWKVSAFVTSFESAIPAPIQNSGAWSPRQHLDQIQGRVDLPQPRVPVERIDLPERIAVLVGQGLEVTAQHPRQTVPAAVLQAEVRRAEPPSEYPAMPQAGPGGWIRSDRARKPGRNAARYVASCGPSTWLRHCSESCLSRSSSS